MSNSCRILLQSTTELFKLFAYFFQCTSLGGGGYSITSSLVTDTASSVSRNLNRDGFTRNINNSRQLIPVPYLEQKENMQGGKLNIETSDGATRNKTKFGGDWRKYSFKTMKIL